MGRCRYCREEISLQYPIIEFITCLNVIFVYHQYGFNLRGVAAVVISCAVITVSVIDLKYYIIPDSVNIFIAVTGFFFMVTGGTVTLKQSMLGFFLGGGVLFVLALLSFEFLKKEGMGGGDIKLAAACGIYLGVRKMLAVFIATSYLAAILLLIMLTLKKIKKDQYIPFGPFLSAGVIIVILFYDTIASIFTRI
jgi:leader peptidase (prepilin peptidase)/N-methyltransferase